MGDFTQVGHQQNVRIPTKVSGLTLFVVSTRTIRDGTLTVIWFCLMVQTFGWYAQI